MSCKPITPPAEGLGYEGLDKWLGNDDHYGVSERTSEDLKWFYLIPIR
jgi:hypothetical protein